jgi:hypothetical protein
MDSSESHGHGRKIDKEFLLMLLREERLNMKARMFTLATAVLLSSVSGWANDKMKSNIQISHTLQVGSTQLAPGEYKMTWTQNGSDAEVSFSQGKKVVATVQARATRGRSGYPTPALHIAGSNTLIAVDLAELSLSFTSTSENAGPTNPSN